MDLSSSRSQIMTRNRENPSVDDSKSNSRQVAKVGLIKSPLSSSPVRGLPRIMLAHSLFLALFGFACQRVLASMSLPDGIENMLGFVPSSSFKCERDGYFGDIENDCRLFHLCQKQISSSGKVEWRHWTYACGNQTMFNQLTLTCAFVDEAIPCRHASQFQYLNEVIHKPREPFLTDADVTSGVSYYTNRIMSDGARNRAFEDSNLMAQLGGGSSFLNNQQPFQGEFVPAEPTNRQPQIQFQQQNSNLNLNFQRPPQAHQQQQQQFFTSNRNQPLDTDDSSSRTINSIELPDLPLTAAFQSLSRQATVAADPDRQDGRQQDLVLINHSGNRQQQQEQQPQLQFFAFPEGRFTHSAAAAPAPEPIAVLGGASSSATAFPASSTGETGSASVLGQQQNQQQQANVQQQQQQPNPLASFNFAVSTDHQLGPSTSSHSTLFASNPQQQQQQNNHLNFQTTEPTLGTSAQATQVPSLPTSAPTTTVQPTTTTTTTTPTTTVAATTTTLTNAPTPTSTSGRLAEPTTTSFVAATTTTTTTAAAAATATALGSAGTQLARQPGRISGATTSRFNQANRRGTTRVASASLTDTHPMRHFQSNRLSAMKKQQQPQATESAVVMRRQPTTTVATPPASSQRAGSSSPPVAAISSIGEPETLWKRPFDMQFIVPRFESFLTRRRV